MYSQEAQLLATRAANVNTEVFLALLDQGVRGCHQQYLIAREAHHAYKHQFCRLTRRLIYRQGVRMPPGTRSFRIWLRQVCELQNLVDDQGKIFRQIRAWKVGLRVRLELARMVHVIWQNVFTILSVNEMPQESLENLMDLWARLLLSVEHLDTDAERLCRQAGRAATGRA